MMSRWLPKIVFFAALIAVWELFSLLHVWPEFLFPSPHGVGSTLLGGFTDGTYAIGIGVSMLCVLAGYLISLAIGLPLGLVIGRVRLLDETVGVVLTGLQTLPSICWLPLALLWFGLNESAILFVVVMGSLLSISISAEDGVKNTPPKYMNAARNMGARRLNLYLHVVLPAALPAILTGMKLGWSFAWRSLMAGELLYVSLGLGQLLMMGRDLNDMSQVIAVMLVIIAIGLVVESLIFAPMEQRARERWGLAA
jgi:NitT/TauT family transport system permease protein